MIDVIDDETYGLNACYENVKFHVKHGDDPIRLLGKYILRAEQDPLFNEKMIEATKMYIRDNNIQWND